MTTLFGTATQRQSIAYGGLGFGTGRELVKKCSTKTGAYLANGFIMGSKEKSSLYHWRRTPGRSYEGKRVPTGLVRSIR